MLFLSTCFVAITVGSWIRIGWLNPFTTAIIPWTVVVSFFSGWGALFYAALLILFVVYLRSEGSWVWLPVTFLIQGVDAYLMAG